jgi:hypothetical protein
MPLSQLAEASSRSCCGTPGPEAYIPAALSFYRALRIYPAPAELIGSACLFVLALSRLANIA